MVILFDFSVFIGHLFEFRVCFWRSIRKKRSIRVEGGRHFNGSVPLPLQGRKCVYIVHLFDFSAIFGHELECRVC